MYMSLYQIAPTTLNVIPASRRQKWMNDNPHVYKCGPVTNANAFGWDIVTTMDVKGIWDGTTSKDGLLVSEGSQIAHSNFGHGVLTFVTGYTFHTEQTWSLYITNIPNEENDTFKTMTALIETDTLKYPFFPSVILKKPGDFTIEKNTPICRIFPIQTTPVISCEPTITREPEDFLKYRQWQTEERDKNKSLPPEKIERWQKFYHNIAKNPVIKMKEIKNEF